MFTSNQYQLLDFGDGRRLERFGPIVLDRPCPMAEGVSRADPAAWESADARFDRIDAETGRWTCVGDLPERWTIACGRLVLEMKRTDFGHVGVFPEQAENWDWLAERLAAGPSAERPRVLNLFAYTGGSTLAAAAARAEVVHVDAAKNIVAWARHNAELSGLGESPVRWIVDDAMKFVTREVRRGSRYDAVILDPPSYGHGSRGQVWRLSRHLPRLLTLCGELTRDRRRFVLLTCHTPGFPPARLREMMEATLGRGNLVARHISVTAATGRQLPSGVMTRWEP